ncbi:MAG: adenine-specific methyltransferase EcoRI family protein [Deltaproteobacteria bacterium]|nr:adenine-specific methyltransferase EcoRI family protein [Deltaproteobacteria bacterium]
MSRKPSNRDLRAAAAAKKDEFYTQLTDIEKELRHYTKHFKGKTVLCNCDDPKVSNFFHYFSHNFEKLSLKKLITTCYRNCNADLFSKHNAESGIYLEYDGDKKGNRVPDPEEIGIYNFKGDGDFRSAECIDLLKQADIVVTNPPFSLFREYVEQLVKYKKKFLIIGHINAVHYKEIFKLIKVGKLWLGESIHSGDREFGVPDHYPLQAAGYRIDEKGNKYIRIKGVRWYTNMDNPNRHELLPLYKTYSAAEYPRYDNFDAIEVSKTSEIPCDYGGLMGVPDAFIDKYNPDQFELIGIPFGDLGKAIGVTRNYRGRTDIAITNDGKSRCPYSRIIIKRKK